MSLFSEILFKKLHLGRTKVHTPFDTECPGSIEVKSNGGGRSLARTEIFLLLLWSGHLSELCRPCLVNGKYLLPCGSVLEINQVKHRKHLAWRTLVLSSSPPSPARPSPSLMALTSLQASGHPPLILGGL